MGRLSRLLTAISGMPMPYAQARLLVSIDDLGTPRLGELAVADGCAQPTMTTQVRRLENAGWVTRHRDPHDSRAVRFSLTAEGRTVLADLRVARAATLEPHLAKLDRAERQALADSLDPLRRLVTELTGTTKPTDPPTSTPGAETP